MRRAIQLVWLSAPGWTVLNGICVILQGILPVVSLVLLKRCINAVSFSVVHAHSPAAIHKVLLYVALLAAITVVMSLVRTLGLVFAQCQALEVTDHVQDVLHKKSVEIDLSYYENSEYYNTLHRAQADAAFRPTRIVNNLLQMAQSAISLICIAGLLMNSLSPGFALLLVVAAIPGVVGKFAIGRSTYEWQRRKTAKERKSQYFNWMLTLDAYAKEVRLFELGEYLKRMSKRLRGELRVDQLAIAWRKSIADAVAQTCAAAALFGSFGYLALQAARGVYSIGALVMFYQAFQRGQSALQDLLSSVSDLYENNLYLANLFDFLDLDPGISDPPVAVSCAAPMRDGLELNNVSFKYANSDRHILKNVSLKIQPGETVALVGQNGSGKTTLVKLLCRLYDPDSGKITIDGVDIREMSPVEYRRRFSVIFQDFAHYFLPARENIWFGDVNHPLDMAKVEHAARLSGADAVIERLPDGYDTMLGYAYEGGQELSIGQWQKIALSRAFMRDCDIMVLDEPTSALDPKAEQEIFGAFARLAAGKTAIIISHRLSTVKMADRIYLLEDGQIAEYGNHKELIALHGKYADLYETQASSYCLA